MLQYSSVKEITVMGQFITAKESAGMGSSIQ